MIKEATIKIDKEPAILKCNICDCEWDFGSAIKKLNIDRRLKNIKRLIAVSGSKGGIGKSVIASTLALVLAKFGYKVGLLDLDFSCPSTHIILGVKDVYPKIENMKAKVYCNTSIQDIVKEEMGKFNIKFLGVIDFDINFEASFGDISELLKTGFAHHIKKIASFPPFSCR